jgi:hypothetical protein
VLYREIVPKESGDNHIAVNPDTGALGLGQQAEVNCGWDYDVLGRDALPQEFLQNPEIQRQIVEVNLKSA